MKETKGFSERLLEAIKAKGCTRADLSRLLGCSQSTILDWIAKGAIPNAVYMAEMSDFLGVDANYLLFGEKDNFDFIKNKIRTLKEEKFQKLQKYVDNQDLIEKEIELLKGLSEEEIGEIQNYINYLKFKNIDK